LQAIVWSASPPRYIGPEISKPDRAFPGSGGIAASDCKSFLISCSPQPAVADLVLIAAWLPRIDCSAGWLLSRPAARPKEIKTINPGTIANNQMNRLLVFEVRWAILGFSPWRATAQLLFHLLRRMSSAGRNLNIHVVCWVIGHGNTEGLVAVERARESSPVKRFRIVKCLSS
jgi:hypothetical protein